MAIIGIDLGTSTCEIAYFKDGKPQIILNDKGERITPSYVGIDTNGDIVVGQDAKDQFIGRRQFTTMEFKRLMGTNEKIRLGDKLYFPEEISAIMLKYLKECAEKYLKEEVTEAVITVPANFNNTQREATLNAAKLAGLKVERLINEPTAAALAFGLKNIDKNLKVLVFDFGGGTLDVTVLEIFDGVIDVMSSYGDPFLGGKDFDERLCEFIIQEMKRRINFHVAQDDFLTMSKIKAAAEEAKKNLSFDKEALIVIENVYSNGNIIDFKIKISREEFEEMVFDLVGRAGYIIDKALEDKDLSYDDIDLVLMVGGTTRIPLVRKYVKEKLNKDIKTEINPDEAVALGAAIQAAIMSGKMDEEKGLMITDICPYNLGVASVAEINGQLFADVFSKIIERNTTIPTSKSKEFYTLYDNQTEVEIKAYQTLDNDCLFVDDATFIGSFHLSGIPENKAGKEAILVEFSYDLNGNIKITATIKSNGISKDLEIKNQSSLSLDQVIEKMDAIDDSWKKSRLASKYKITIETAEKKIKQMDDIKLKNELFDLVVKLKEYIKNEDEENADLIDGRILDFILDI